MFRKHHPCFQSILIPNPKQLSNSFKVDLRLSGQRYSEAKSKPSLNICLFSRGLKKRKGKINACNDYVL